MIFAFAAALISFTSLFTSMFVKFFQIFKFVFIVLLVPELIAIKTLEARVNIANKARFLGGKNGKKVIQSPPTEVVDNKSNIDTFGVKFSQGLPDKTQS